MGFQSHACRVHTEINKVGEDAMNLYSEPDKEDEVPGSGIGDAISELNVGEPSPTVFFGERALLLDVHYRESSLQVRMQSKLVAANKSVEASTARKRVRSISEGQSASSNATVDEVFSDISGLDGIIENDGSTLR
jgi:hypothetical protein